MGLYRIKITNYDNVVLKEMEVDYAVNLSMLLPFASNKNEDGKQISIELINSEKIITIVYINLEYLLLSIETISEYFSIGKFGNLKNNHVNNEKILDYSSEGNSKAEQFESKNKQALEFYTKSKWRKYSFFAVTLLLIVSVFFRAINDFKKGTALSAFSGGGMVFIMIFLMVSVLVIIKKIQSKKLD